MNIATSSAAGEQTVRPFSLRPTVGCDLVELAHLEAEADRFRRSLVELELAFFRRVVRSVFEEHPGLEIVTVESGGDEGAFQVFLDGDLEPAAYHSIRAKLESALGHDAIPTAVGNWTRQSDPGTKPGSLINTYA